MATGGGADVDFLRRCADEAREEGDLAGAAQLEEQVAAIGDIELLPWVGEWWRAFWWLNRGRAYRTVGAAGPGGMMLKALPQPIGFEAIDGYARRAELSGGDFEDLLEIIGKMDVVWLEAANDRG